MKNHLKVLYCRRIFFILFIAILLGKPNNLTAEDSTKFKDKILPALSLSIPLSTDLLGFLPLFNTELAQLVPWIQNPVMLLSHIPLYSYNIKKALAYTGIELLEAAGGVGLMFASGGNDFIGTASNSLLNGYINTARYAVYEVYSEADVLGSEYSSPMSIIRGQFDLSNITEPIVYIPALAGTAVLSTFMLSAWQGDENAVYKTGSAYVGNSALHPVAGFIFSTSVNLLDMSLVAIGEESLYRGVLYQQIKDSSGVIPARAADMLIFPLIHLSTDLKNGFDNNILIFNFIYRSLMTLCFDIAYDKGGLPLSSAVHMWSDVMLLTMKWLFYGGAPQYPETAVNNIVTLPQPGISWGFRY
jgi:membrane protease YdiL (CAAX protease family)